MSRIVRFYTTLGKLIKVETDATTWGELKGLAQDEGVNTSETKATVSTNKTTLDHDDAHLPEGEFTVFFTKINSKAGAELSYREVRTKVKELVNSSEEAARHFNQDLNYTNKSKDTLIDLLEEWESMYSEEVEEEKVEKVAQLEEVILPFKNVLAQVIEHIENEREGTEEDEKFSMDIEDFMEEVDEDELITISLISEGEYTTSEEDEELKRIREEGKQLGIIS